MKRLNTIRYNKTRVPILFLLLILFLLPGCTLSILDTGETLPPHKMEVGISTPIPYSYDASYLSCSDLYFRSGLGDNLDYEIRAFYIGILGNYKYRLVKSPFTLSAGMGGGYNWLFGTDFWEITGYLSKKFRFVTPYTAYRYNWISGKIDTDTPTSPTFTGNYPIIAFGIKIPLVYWLDLLGETDAIASQGQKTLYYGSVRLNFHDVKLKTIFKNFIGWMKSE